MPELREELRELRRLKREAEERGREKTAADDAFKQHQARVIEDMQAAGDDSMGTDGTLFSLVEKTKGFVDDRRAYVRWALEQDEGVQEFLAETLAAVPDPYIKPEEWVERFYATVTGTALVTYKEIGEELNRIAAAHIEDGTPLPPGLNFRPAPYISQRAR